MRFFAFLASAIAILFPTSSSGAAPGQDAGVPASPPAPARSPALLVAPTDSANGPTAADGIVAVVFRPDAATSLSVPPTFRARFVHAAGASGRLRAAVAVRAAAPARRAGLTPQAGGIA